MRRRTFAFALSTLAARPRPLLAESWPGRPIRILAGYSVGTTTDLLARVVAQGMSEQLENPVVVENREGAGGTIAASQVLRAAADGTTLLLGASNLTIAPLLFRQVTFRPLEDFSPIGMIGYAPNVLVIHPGQPIHTVAELIAAAKATPGRLRYASSGPGSGSWIGMEQLKMMAGIDLQEVPYSSTAQAATDAISGRVELHFPSLAGGMPLLRDGRLRPLGITSAERSASAPDIPAIAETLPGYDTSLWFGLLGPAGLPKEAVDRLAAAFLATLADAKTRTVLGNVGVDPKPGGPEALRTAMQAGVRSGEELTRRLNYQPQ